MKFISSLPSPLNDEIIRLKANELVDAWLDTYETTEGATIPSYAEEELLSDYDHAFGTNLLEQAQWFYEMLDKVIINPEEES